MPAIIALLIAFFIGLSLRRKGINEIKAWLISCLVMPTFVLSAEFILPYMGGGASMWPIALVVGGFLGMFAGGFGVIVGSFYLNREKKHSNNGKEK